METAPSSDNPFASPNPPTMAIEGCDSARPRFKLWRFALFLFSFGAVLTQPAFTSYYYEWMLDHGAYPPHADSIAIPVMGNLLFWFLWAPVLTIVFFIAFWQLQSPPHVLAWQRNKKVKSTLITLLCLGCAYLVAETIPATVRWGNWGELAYTAWWIIVWLLVRAALLTSKISPRVIGSPSSTDSA